LGRNNIAHAPEIVADVIAAARSGLRPREIAEGYGGAVSINTIYGWLSEARMAGADVPLFPAGRRPGEGDHRLMPIARSLLPRLEAAAAARGIETRDLVERVLQAVLSDNLIDAVLDDSA
jgi:transposase